MIDFLNHYKEMFIHVSDKLQKHGRKKVSDVVFNLLSLQSLFILHHPLVHTWVKKDCRLCII